MGRLILRVDDVGWFPPEKTKDESLQYFASWREVMGLSGYPVYYGLIPAMAGPKELDWCAKNLRGDEELAIHGSTHTQGEIVNGDEMQIALNRFSLHTRCRSYIPPFNKYDDRTLEAWGQVCRQGFFFGGFHCQDHKFGNLPVACNRLYHIPAFRPTYDHTEPLLKQLPNWLDLDCPLVVTLHATWGWDKLQLLAELAKIIKPHLVSADYIRIWHDAITLSKVQLTAPHYLAYKAIIDRLDQDTLGKKALDFGCRYSPLPSQLALRGYRVTAVDRDPYVVTYQQEVAARYCNPKLDVQKIIFRRDITGKYDLITACWALQHNKELHIGRYAQRLASCLNPKGRLMVVSSFTNGPSFHQTNRPDPQFVMNWQDHCRYVIEPSRLEIVSQKPFYYEHGTTIGDYCGVEKANAIFYELRKL